MITCQFEHGKVASLRHVTVEGIVTFYSGHEVLMIRRAKHLAEGGKLALPGGYLERDETIPEGLEREVLEETGYACKVVSLFRIMHDPIRRGEDKQNVTFVFIMEVVEKQANHDDETLETCWLKVDEDLPDEDEFAFAHYEVIQQYRQHLRQPFRLPIF